MIPRVVKDLCDFVDASPTACHAADNIATALRAAGARQLDETGTWDIEPGVLQFVVRGGSSVIAFRAGLATPAESGFAVAGAHTDSPALKARWAGTADSPRGMSRVPVEVYGGPILSTWIDRPLALAGRVTTIESGRPVTRLVNTGVPVGIIPNLAIHLNREVNKGFEYNPQAHLPVLVDVVRPGVDSSPGPSPLGRLLALESGIDPETVVGTDLFFVVHEKATFFGARDGNPGFLNAPRLDDLAGCHSILEAFVHASAAPWTQVACFLDSEEIGSRTLQGADSSFLRDFLARLSYVSGCDAQGFYRALARSFFVSVDAAQAWHPAYKEKFDDAFSPALNGGPAIKKNAAFKYATDAVSELAFSAYCRKRGIDIQRYMARADTVPGSTIGPMVAAHTGIRTVDVGHPLLSMHSARESMGVADHEAMTGAIQEHFDAMATLG